MITNVIFCRIGRSRSFSIERIPNSESWKSYFHAERKELRSRVTPFSKPATASAPKSSSHPSSHRGGGTYFASERASVSDTAGHQVCRIQKHTRSNHFMNLSPPQTEKPANPPRVRRETSEQFQDANVHSEPGSKNNRVFTAALLVALAIALGLGFWSLSRQLAPQLITSSTSKEESSANSLPEKSVAVLPFENLSDNNENSFLADGVQGDILSALSKFADLKPIALTSVNTLTPPHPRNLPQ